MRRDDRAGGRRHDGRGAVPDTDGQPSPGRLRHHGPCPKSGPSGVHRASTPTVRRTASRSSASAWPPPHPPLGAASPIVAAFRSFPVRQAPRSVEDIGVARALRYALARLAVDLVSGPAGVASILRRGLLEHPWAWTPWRRCCSSTSATPRETEGVHPPRGPLARPVQVRLAPLRPPGRLVRRPPHQAQEGRRQDQRRLLHHPVSLSSRHLHSPMGLADRPQPRRHRLRLRPRRPGPAQPLTADSRARADRSGAGRRGVTGLRRPGRPTGLVTAWAGLACGGPAWFPVAVLERGGVPAQVTAEPQLEAAGRDPAGHMDALRLARPSNAVPRRLGAGRRTPARPRPGPIRRQAARRYQPVVPPCACLTTARADPQSARPSG